MSYPSTGSTGDAYKWAEKLGHRVAAPRPALVPLVDRDGICSKMQGLSLKNVRFTLIQEGREIYSGQGEMLFTHFGLSGPIILTASSYIDHGKNMDTLKGVLDIKPALSEEQLDARLLRDFKTSGNKLLKTYLTGLMPEKLEYLFFRETGLGPDLRVNQVTRGIREKLIKALKGMDINIAGTRPVSEAIVTAGGIITKEINPSTMESKLVKNLYFAGEAIDVSALTGGYNLQIAFSTGYAAGMSV
jgi:predicted Rossmann fold flavoprotein